MRMQMNANLLAEDLSLPATLKATSTLGLRSCNVTFVIMHEFILCRSGLTTSNLSLKKMHLSKPELKKKEKAQFPMQYLRCWLYSSRSSSLVF